MWCDALGAEHPLVTTSKTVKLPPPVRGNTAVQKRARTQLSERPTTTSRAAAEAARVVEPINYTTAKERSPTSKEGSHTALAPGELTSS